MSTTKAIDITDPELHESYELRDRDVVIEVSLRDALNVYRLNVKEVPERGAVIYRVARGLIPLLVEAALLEESAS